jgi:hypothetical protein
MTGANYVATQNANWQGIGQVNSNGTLTVLNVLGGFKNRLINGDNRIWQRGTSYTLTNSSGYGSTDRWFAEEYPTAAGVLAQSTSAPTGFQYSMQLGRTSSATVTGTLIVGQVIETVNCIPLQGQTVTLSFWVKAGANYSSASNLLTTDIITGTGTDQGSASISSWTGMANNYQAFTLTTSWQRFTQTITLPSNESEIAVEFMYVPVGTAGSDDNVYITGVQLEPGSISSPFEVLPYSTELAFCQRYFSYGIQAIWFSYAGAYYVGSSVQFPVVMRSTPTVSLYSGGAYPWTTTYNGLVHVSDSPVLNETPTFYLQSPSGFVLFDSSSNSKTQLVYSWMASAEL